jgi:RimJ/RimL family protein N-acetyltransferase
MSLPLETAGASWRIRRAGPDDADALTAIMTELAEAEDYILLAPEEIVRDPDQRRDDIVRAVNSGNRWILEVLETRNGVVGMLDLREVPMRKCGHVLELGLGLRAGARGKGYGTVLIGHAIRTAGDLGYRKLRLFVIACNFRARHVYRKAGFVETGRFVDEVQVQGRLEDLVVMERPVP